MPDSGAEGVIVAQGGSVGAGPRQGRQGHLLATASLALEPFIVDSTPDIPQARTRVRMEFAYIGGGLAKGWCPSTSTASASGEEHHGSIAHRAPRGVLRRRNRRRARLGSPVSPEYRRTTTSSGGEVHWVQDRPRKDNRSPDLARVLLCGSRSRSAWVVPSTSRWLPPDRPRAHLRHPATASWRSWTAIRSARGTTASTAPSSLLVRATT